MRTLARGRARLVWAAGAAGTVLVALILAAVLPPLAKQPPATPAPPATAAATTPLTIAATDKGLVVDLGGHGIGLRTETDPTPYFRVENRTQYAVSQDGQLAYWKTGPDDALPHELHVFDTRIRADRTVLTLRDERAGGAGFMVWSTDGLGIALAVHDARSIFEGPDSPLPPMTSFLRLLDLTSGDIRPAGSINGAWLIPLSWDRESGIAAATEIGRRASTDGTPDLGPRLYGYSNSARTFLQVAAPGRVDARSIRVDSAHDWALALEQSTCTEAVCPRVLWTWPLKDPYVARKHTVRGLLTQQFRPGTREVFGMVRDDDGVIRLEDLGASAEGTPREVLAMRAGGGFSFRQDGSAILVPNPDLNNTTGSLGDPESRTSATPIVAGSDVLETIGGTPPKIAPLAAFPESWTLIGTSDGRVQRGVGGTVLSSWKVCDGSVRRIVAPAGDSFTVVVICEIGAGAEQRGFLLQLDVFAASDQGRVTPLPGPMSTNVALSPDSRTLIYTSLAPGDPDAPISKTRVWMLDIGQGRIGTPREILAPEYNLGEVRWTTLGPSVFKPQRAPNGIRGPAAAGTFLFNGTWHRYSLHRLVDATSGPQGRALLEAEPADVPQGPSGAAVVLREGDQETQLTRGDVGGERALVLLDDGRVLAWRRDQDDFHGSVVTYADGRVVRQDPGVFSAFGTFRAGVFADALVGGEFTGPAGLVLRSYSIADHTFATVAPGSVSAVGALVVARSRR